jgi:hypothetical protein
MSANARSGKPRKASTSGNIFPKRDPEQDKTSERGPKRRGQADSRASASPQRSGPTRRGHDVLPATTPPLSTPHR